MQNARFEWDDAKAAANLARHGVSFDAASAVFSDAFAMEWTDDRFDYGEDRHVILGMAEGRLPFVAYTMREERIRIISARGAEPSEKRAYHEDQA